jgi:uncharacterized DUF497 family protein
VPWFDIIWDFEPGGNVEHVAQHGVSTADVEFVLCDPESTGVSRSSGRPVAFGHIPDGRQICVVFEWVDAVIVLPVSAFEVED